MAITFKNTVYQLGFVGEDDGLPKNSFGVDNVNGVSGDPGTAITINGTVTNIGDPVTATGLLPGQMDTGKTATTNTLYVTAFDNAGMIEFSDQPPANQTAAFNQTTPVYRFVLSNSTLTPGQKVTFTQEAAPTLYQAPTCFTTGTLIRTARGEVAVEALRVGDRAVTASGRLRTITWIGHRDLGGELGRDLPHDQQPVAVRKGAFGRDEAGRPVPARALHLSPGHPVLVGADADGKGGHLVPVMCLINGASIARVAVASITYWHVELDSHDILLAEGLPAESYLDWGDRPFFAEAGDHVLANPDFVVPGLSGRCRPVAVDGPVVERERQRLDTVFASALDAQCAWGADWLAA